MTSDDPFDPGRVPPTKHTNITPPRDSQGEILRLLRHQEDRLDRMMAMLTMPADESPPVGATIILAILCAISGGIVGFLIGFWR